MTTPRNFKDTDAPTSRAMHVSATRAEVVALAAKHKAAVSAIEELLSGGTRVVFMNGDDAAVMRKAFKSKVLSGPVVRACWQRAG